MTFLSRGAPSLARDLSSVGDSSALASRGAQVLADVIGKLGDKQDRTAAESVLLSKALRLTGDASDRMAAKVVLADAAVRRLDDGMKEAAKKPLVPQVLEGAALKKLTAIQVKAEELRAKFPQFTVQINDRAAKLELALFAAEAKGDLDRIDKQLGGAGRGGILGRLFGGGAGSAGSSGGGLGSLLPAASGAVNPYTIAAGLAVLPFAAQAAGAGIVAAMGGALAGVAILGAAKTKAVQDSFARLKTSASADLGTIGKSFVPVMTGILSTATSVLAQLTPVYAAAAKTISGPFKAFGDALLRAFNQPAVKQSIADVATSFGKILAAVTPGLARDVGQIATGVSKLAGAVAANPKAFSQFVGFLAATAGGVLTAVAALTRFANFLEARFIPTFDLVRHNVAARWSEILSNTIDVWNKIWAQTIGRAIQGGHDLETQYNNVRKFISTALDAIRSGAVTAWNAVWANTVTRAANGVRDVITWFNNLRAGAVAAMNATAASIAGTWNAIWANTISRVSNGITSVVNFFKGLPGKIAGALGAAGSVLAGWGRGVIQGLLDGMTNIIGSVWTFIKGIPGKILGFLGIKSPPQWAIDAGKHIMNGLGIGMAQAQAKLKIDTSQFSASALAASVGGGGGPSSASASQAQAYAAGRLGAYGWGAAQMKPLIMLWNQESGWNRLARNPSSGAYGIPQALPASKMGAAANPPTSSAGAQIDWGLNYIRGRYGSPAGAWAHEVAFNWYDRGGWLMPGLTLAHNTTGRPEQVIAGDGLAGLGGKLDRLIAEVHQLNGTAAAIPAATGHHVGGAINSAAGSASFARRYPRGGA